MNIFTVTTAFCCLIFCIFLSIVYFSKKNMPNVETKMYRYIIIFDSIVIFFHLAALISGYYVNKIDNMLNVYKITSRIYGSVNLIWCGLLIIYTLLVINDEENNFIHDLFYKKNKVAFVIFEIITVIILVVGCFMPVDIFFVNGIIAYSGAALYYYVIILLIAITITVFDVAIRFKKLNSLQKVSPLIFFGIMQVFNLIANSIDSSINSVPLAITLTSYFMYHRIENPDIKLIAELQLAKDQAEKSNNVKSDFLNSVSNEMRAPINTIVNLSQVMLENDNIEEIKEDTNSIVIASQNILELVNGILDINQLDAGDIEIIEEKYNPTEEFNNIAKKLATRIENKQIKFETKITDKLPNNLYGDIDKVNRIISNLILNSIKYTNSGFIQFSVDCTNEKDFCNLIIIIEDTGIGLKEENKNNNFDKIYQEIKIRNEGKGLGLSITKSLVELLDGKILVKSSIGKGTTFTVELKQKIV